MNRFLPAAALAASVLMAESAVAQQCYTFHNRCFSFAPPPEEVPKVETGVSLRAESLKFTGDIRFRNRMADSPSDKPYADADQSTTRARLQLEFTVNEYATAFLEYNFSEVWAGAEPYSDAQPFQNDPDGILSRQNFNGISQAYMQLDDAFGFEESIRVGRSEYFLANGLILGSCDYLQYPATFTGVWLARSFGDFDAEVFAFDNYGPLQAQLAGGGERFVGTTVRWNVEEGGGLEKVDGYYMMGTAEGEFTGRSNDSWVGVEASGLLPADIKWEAQFAHRTVDGGKDVSAYRAVLEHTFEEPIGGILHNVSFTRTGSQGALHVNPADFNSAGLLHQYGGAWRSNLDTNQLSFGFTPVSEIECTASFLTLDRGTGVTQQGDFEFNLLAGKMIRDGLHVGLGYGIDNDKRQVGFAQATLYF
ncbi:hypothetical protein Pla163_05720 [Planctomycetes bacterium Pla163]|uniref:Alginate export domain-containing protein n=1 Tax=Rohdeia mirabilis TaxID=2528008 RepID=A0A518CW78_9BACT|nr:hypothetical protein Pla163_05720 [Planctomycetes bacterium Pla163]